MMRLHAAAVSLLLYAAAPLSPRQSLALIDVGQTTAKRITTGVKI